MVMRIKELREAKGIQQSQLASSMGICQNRLSNWEHEVSLPRARDLPQLAKVLDVTIDELFVSIEDVS